MPHTPGPWKLDGGKGKKGELYIWNDLDEEKKGFIGSLETCVAIANAGRFSKETLVANANLIMAAPDLLAALERLMEERNPFISDTETCECGDGNGRDENGNICEHVQAQRAIAKAKGQKS